MKLLKTTLVVLSLASGSFALDAAAAPIVYSQRAAFQSTLGTSITDTYSDPGYGIVPGGIHILSDAQMSAVLGEVDYQSTTFNNLNIIFDNAPSTGYCAGCNGSFRLGFTHTSVGSSAGVFGVGLDVNGMVAYVASVQFGDGSFQDVNLPQLFDDGNPNTIGDHGFFGITSDQLITSIHFGGPNGTLSPIGFIQIDNLTFGGPAVSVPEPASLAMFGFGLALLGVARRRKAQ